ncbi:MAG: hypothetical protein ABEJ97_08420 [Halobellus sp.]
MSHERGPAAPRGEAAPPTPEHRILNRVKRHFLEWADRYVEMRVRAVEK